MGLYKNKFFIGLLVAPVFGPIVFTLFLVLFGALIIDKKVEINSFSQIFDGFLVVLIIGMPISYLITMIVGLPAYKICKRLDYLNYWSVSIGGGLSACFPIVTIYLINSLQSMNRLLSFEGFVLLLVLFFCGFVVGNVFWFITRTNENQRKA